MPTVADIAPLARLLSHLIPGEPIRHQALACVPLLAPGLDDPAWLTLGDAGDTAAITEVTEDGLVPELSVTNGSDCPLLLLDGEELVGAKQNRVLNTTVLVAARSRLTIPVSCVEQGRWHYRGRRFSASPDSLFASLRARKAARVSSALRQGFGHRSDQYEIWAALRAEADERGVSSETEAMHDIYERHRALVEAARQALAPRPAQVGALVYRSGQWIGVDVLAGPALFARAWPRLCAGYVADAIDCRDAPTLDPAPAVVLERLPRAAAEPAPAVGLGVEHRLGGGGLTGATLVAEGRVAHLMAFPLPPGVDS